MTKLNSKHQQVNGYKYMTSPREKIVKENTSKVSNSVEQIIKNTILTDEEILDYLKNVENNLIFEINGKKYKAQYDDYTQQVWYYEDCVNVENQEDWILLNDKEIIKELKQLISKKALNIEEEKIDEVKTTQENEETITEENTTVISGLYDKYDIKTMYLTDDKISDVNMFESNYITPEQINDIKSGYEKLKGFYTELLNQDLSKKDKNQIEVFLAFIIDSINQIENWHNTVIKNTENKYDFINTQEALFCFHLASTRVLAREAYKISIEGEKIENSLDYSIYMNPFNFDSWTEKTAYYISEKRRNLNLVVKEYLENKIEIFKDIKEINEDKKIETLELKNEKVKVNENNTEIKKEISKEKSDEIEKVVNTINKIKDKKIDIDSKEKDDNEDIFEKIEGIFGENIGKKEKIIENEESKIIEEVKVEEVEKTEENPGKNKKPILNTELLKKYLEDNQVESDVNNKELFSDIRNKSVENKKGLKTKISNVFRKVGGFFKRNKDIGEKEESVENKKGLKTKISNVFRKVGGFFKRNKDIGEKEESVQKKKGLKEKMVEKAQSFKNLFKKTQSKEQSQLNNVNEKNEEYFDENEIEQDEEYFDEDKIEKNEEYFDENEIEQDEEYFDEDELYEDEIEQDEETNENLTEDEKKHKIYLSYFEDFIDNEQEEGKKLQNTIHNFNDEYKKWFDSFQNQLKLGKITNDKYDEIFYEVMEYLDKNKTKIHKICKGYLIYSTEEESNKIIEILNDSIVFLKKYSD